MTRTPPDLPGIARGGRRPEISRDGDGRGPSRAVAAIGNFDGVHLGHRRLIETAKARAGEGRPAAVLTFEPHPRDHFRPDEPGFRLTSPATKLKILGALGVDLVFVRRFDAVFAALSAEAFVREILAGELGLSAIVTGANFHFGRDRAGTPALLVALAEAAGLDAIVEPAVELDGAPVSSSRVRDALARGEVSVANRMLGHRWFIEAEVVHGEKRGRTLGYPTANCRLDPGCRLAHGIYAVRVATADGRVHGGVASFGRRPTFDDGAPLLETFVFDFAGDLYGQRVEVEFLAWIRGEARFASADELVRAMDRDAAEARSTVAGAAQAPGPVSLIG